MGKQRPSTLKAWRILLDVCKVLDDKTGYTSIHEIAELLQALYRDKFDSPEKRKLYFGLDPVEATDPGEAFPSQSTVVRYLDLVEADLMAFFPSRRLIPRVGTGDRSAFGRPDSRDVQAVRSIGEGLFRQLRGLAEERRPLLLATSDSVSSFLLPRVRVTAAIGKRLQPRARKFTPSDVVHALLAGDIDAAVGWHRGYQQDVEDHSGIATRDLAGSECRVSVLFSPLQSDLGKRKLEYITAHQADDPEGAGFTLHPECLRGVQLIYPDLHQLARIVDAFEYHRYAEGYLIDHFASVLSAVRANNGVGLFFGLPWLLREIEHQHRVYSATLAVPDEWNLDLTMRLKSYTRKGDTSPATREATAAADNLLTALEVMLVNNGYPPPMAKPEWRLAGPAGAKKEAFREGAVWNVAFVTSGRFERVVSPRWLTGRIEFGDPEDDGRPRGTLYLARDDYTTKFMDVWAELEPIQDGVLVLRFKRIEVGASLCAHTIAYFPSRITCPSFDGSCFVGSLSFAVSGRPFCSPILLSNRPLAEPGMLREACKSVARSHVFDFLFGDEPDA